MAPILHHSLIIFSKRARSCKPSKCIFTHKYPPLVVKKLSANIIKEVAIDMKDSLANDQLGSIKIKTNRSFHAHTSLFPARQGTPSKALKNLFKDFVHFAKNYLMT